MKVIYGKVLVRGLIYNSYVDVEIVEAVVVELEMIEVESLLILVLARLRRSCSNL